MYYLLLKKLCKFRIYIPKGQKSLRLLSENIKETFGLNKNKLCLYWLSKKCNSGITECISLKLSEMIREINSWPQRQYFHATIQPLLLRLQFWSEIWPKSKDTAFGNAFGYSVGSFREYLKKKSNGQKDSRWMPLLILLKPLHLPLLVCFVLLLLLQLLLLQVPVRLRSLRWKISKSILRVKV